MPKGSWGKEEGPNRSWWEFPVFVVGVGVVLEGGGGGGGKGLHDDAHG